MSEHFITDAWKAKLGEADSSLCKMLGTSQFQDQDQGLTEEQITFMYLAIYGFLNCVGKPAEKVEILFNILQDGGIDSNPNISASDKDYSPTMVKLFRFATLDLFTIAEFTMNIKNEFTDEE